MKKAYRFPTFRCEENITERCHHCTALVTYNLYSQKKKDKMPAGKSLPLLELTEQFSSKNGMFETDYSVYFSSLQSSANTD